MNIQQLIKEQTSPEWQEILLSYPNFEELNAALTKEYETYEPDIKILPFRENIFRAFTLCPFDKLKICFTGMDPYIQLRMNKKTGEVEPEANGLAFSVNEGLKLPPSLRNLIKEMQDDIGGEFRSSDFSELASQGILFLNSALTVRQFKSGSHSKIWKKYTDWILEKISKEKQKDGLVFILLGKHAQDKKKIIQEGDTSKEAHFYVEAVHPSPLSAHKGFFGSKIFSKCNDILENQKKTKIDW